MAASLPRRTLLRILGSAGAFLGLVRPAAAALFPTPPQSTGPFYPPPADRFADTDWDLVKVAGRVRAAGGQVAFDDDAAQGEAGCRALEIGVTVEAPRHDRPQLRQPRRQQPLLLDARIDRTRQGLTGRRRGRPGKPRQRNGQREEPSSRHASYMVPGGAGAT